jgi:hypothetical protein
VVHLDTGTTEWEGKSKIPDTCRPEQGFNCQLQQLGACEQEQAVHLDTKTAEWAQRNEQQNSLIHKPGIH